MRRLHTLILCLTVCLASPLAWSLGDRAQFGPPLTEDVIGLSQFERAVDQFLVSPGGVGQYQAIYKLKKGLFHLNRKNYLAALAHIEKRWAQSPNKSLQLIGQLQLHWQLLYHKELSARTNNEIDEMSRSGMIIGLAAMSAVLFRNPKNTPKYLKLFSYLFPITGLKGGELIGKGMAEMEKRAIPPSPAEVLQDEFFQARSDIELQTIVDELTATSIALGGSAAIGRLQELRSIAQTGAKWSARAGRIAKQALIVTALFVVIEAGAEVAISQQRLSNLLDSETDGLFLLRDGLQDSFRKAEPKSNYFLNLFLRKTDEVKRFLLLDALEVHQEYLAALQELELKAVPTNSSEERLSKERSELSDQFSKKLKRSFLGTCYVGWQRLTLIDREISGEKVSLESSVFTGTGEARRVLQRKIQFLNARKLAPNPPSFWTRNFSNYSRYYEKQFIEAMQTPKWADEYLHSLADEKERILNHWLQSYREKRICKTPNSFLKQTELFLRSLDQPSAELAADLILSENKVFELL